MSPPKVDKKESEKKMVSKVVKGNAAVDSFVPNANKYHVYQAAGKVYDCTMN